MDYIEWTEKLFRTLVALHLGDNIARATGVHETKLCAEVFGEDRSRSAEFHTSQERIGLLHALDDLESCGVVEKIGSAFASYKPSPAAKGLERDFMPLWQDICREELDPDQVQFLEKLAALSHVEHATFAGVVEVPEQPILDTLGWPEGMMRAWPIAQELIKAGMIKGQVFGGPSFRGRMTYRGWVWLNKRAFTEEAQFLDALVKEWETTSVEFKREVHTDTAGEKAELVKDLLSLVNTKASGRRWLIIGFDDKTRQWCCEPNPKLGQDHLEQLVNAYTDPPIELRYEVVGYRGGKVGKLEVRRDPVKIPYQVRQSVGDRKRRIEAGQVFVRHGSQVEEATRGELEALVEEGKRARDLR